MQDMNGRNLKMSLVEANVHVRKITSLFGNCTYPLKTVNWNINTEKKVRSLFFSFDSQTRTQSFWEYEFAALQ